jgi:hypothetical protein
MRIHWVLSAVFGIVAIAGQPAQAAVTLTFLSRDLGVDFPHAFVETTGATDADPGTAVRANYGFTAKVVSPAILMGPVSGEIMAVSDGYVHGSDRHFSVQLTDRQYAQLLGLIDDWRHLPGRSYDLHKRNCVHFVRAVAEFAGLDVRNTDALMLKPRSFLDEVALENADKIETVATYRPKLKKSLAVAQPSPSR